MGYDGSGNFSRAENFTADRDAGIKIRADRMDTEFNNFSVGMNAVLLRSGVASMTGTLNMGMNAIAGLPDGTAFVPAMRFASDATTGIFSSGFGKIALSAGATNRLEANSTGVGVTGTLAVVGAATISTTLGVTGVLTASSNATVGGTLGVTGVLTASSNATVGGTLGVTGVLTASSNATVGGTLGVTGVVSLTVPLAVASGGTGSATAGGARTNLGVTATGADTAYAFRANNLSDLGSASTARTNLGLGTVATQNTGTSGTVIPFLDGANTWSNAQSLSNTLFLSGGNAFGSALSGNAQLYHSTVSGLIIAGAGTTYDFTLMNKSGSPVFSVTTGTVNADFAGGITLATALPLASGGTGNATAAGARTNLGLGTAAVQNTGTSGANIPFLNGTNTWGAQQIINVNPGSIAHIALQDSTATTHNWTIGFNSGAQANDLYFRDTTQAGAPIIFSFANAGMAPVTNNTYGLGTSSLRWSTGYMVNLNVSGTATLSGGATVTGTMNATTEVQENSVPLGYKNLVSQTGGLVAGKLFTTSAGFTINTGAAADTTYMVYNDSAAAITLTQGAGLTLRLAGTTTTGNRTLAPRGFATLWSRSTTEIVCNGNVT